MWNWDENNPWKCSDKNHCNKDPYDDNQCDDDFDSGFDLQLLHKIIKCLFNLKKEIDKCESLLCNPKFGLKEIKQEVRNIERAVFSPTFGLSEIKAEVSIIQTIVGGIQDNINNPAFGLSEIKAEISNIESAIFSETFGLSEIKAEVSDILSIVSNLIIDVDIPITLLSDIKSEVSAIESAVFSSTFGLSEIKAEISNIESAVFSETFGLSEIKAEISQILANQGVSLFLTSGPFLVECEEQNLVVKALNNSTVPQSVTFVVRSLAAIPPTPITEFLGPIDPCSAAETFIPLTDAGLSPGNLEIRAIRSSTDLLVYATTTTCSGRKVNEFKSSDFLAVATFCFPVV